MVVDRRLPARPEQLSATPGDDADSFTAWVGPHWTAIQHLAARLCGSQDGEDVAQEALGSAWRKRAQFDPARGTARAWLLAVVADQARKQHRRRRPTVELTDDVARKEPAAADGLDLRDAIARLTERQRLAIALFYYLGLPVSEVAEVMACSAGTVKSTLADARARLRTSRGGEYR